MGEKWPGSFKLANRGLSHSNFMLFYILFSSNRRRKAIDLTIKFVQTKSEQPRFVRGWTDSGFKTDALVLVEHDCAAVWRISSDVPSSRQSNDGQLIRDFTIETQGWIFWSRLIHLAGSNSPVTAAVETAGESDTFQTLSTDCFLFSFLFRKVRQSWLEPGEIEIAVVKSQPQSEHNI